MSPTAVTKSPPTLVPPAAATPVGYALPLSSIDKTTAARVSIDSVHVFICSDDDVKRRSVDVAVSPAKAVREGIAKALVSYYPIAGKIVEPTPGEPEVELTSEGVWFVEATASCTLADVKFLQRPLMIPKEELLPLPPPHVSIGDAIFMAQVTEFACGGYAVGVRSSHTVMDGQGIGQFLIAIGEMARNALAPSVTPVWNREAIPSPPRTPPPGPPPSLTAFQFATSVFDVPSGSIDKIKGQFAGETGRKCSTFDVVTALLYKCRAHAIGLPATADVRVSFAASVRHLLQGVIPKVEGYYGNCVYPVVVTRASAEIITASLTDIIALVKAAKDELPARFAGWMDGSKDGVAGRHYRMTLDYGLLAVSDWSRAGFQEVDHGWGPTYHVLPLNDDVNFLANAIYLRPPPPGNGIRLMLRCVEDEHCAALLQALSLFA